MRPFYRRLAGVVGAIAALYSCASVGTIEGGPKDETPPVFLASTPLQGALNNSKTKVSLVFDEYLQLSNASEKLVISPPQVQQPEISTNGKKVIIKLQDTLKANTTYTFDFGDAIQDNNEGNPLENFFYSFSTSEILDSMTVAGTLLNASDLEPVKGSLVGLHANLNDTAFTSLPFDRVGRTDSRGHFSIRGVAPGTYRIYALQDADQNYFYNQPTEVIAYNDSLIIPSLESRTRQDTTWIDSLTIDTIVTRGYTHYLPDDVLLRCFKKEYYSQRFLKSERLVPNKFSLYFSAPADSLPLLKGLNFDEKDAFIIEQPTGRNDTIHYWIKDSLLYKQDSLQLSITYLCPDSLEQLVPRTDTLNVLPKLSYAKQQQQLQEAKEKEAKETEKENKKRRKKGEEEENPADSIQFLPVDVYAPASLDIYDYLTLTFKEPVVKIDTSAFHVRQKVDSLWQDIPFDFERDSLDIMCYNIFADWVAGESYTFEVDSASIVGLYGLFTNKIKKDMKVKTLEEYGQIFFNVQGACPNAFVQLLSAQDKVLRTVKVKDGKADFYFLNPAQYGARLIDDTNGNGKWDTGSYEEKRQPEMVYYYPLLLELKANFELTQEWDIHEKPLDKQKPDDMKTQKPDDEKKDSKTKK